VNHNIANRQTTDIEEKSAIFSSTGVVIDVNITLYAADCILNMFKRCAEEALF